MQLPDGRLQVVGSLPGRGAFRRSAAIVAVGAGLQACGGSGRPAVPAQTASSTPSATAARFPRALTGTWGRRLTTRDWKRAGELFATGTWRIEVAGDGGGARLPPEDDDGRPRHHIHCRRHQADDQRDPDLRQPGSLSVDGVEAAGAIRVVEDDCRAGAAVFDGTWRRLR
jgi:hypothetical protein